MLINFSAKAIPIAVGTPCPMFLVDASYKDIMKIVKGKWENPTTVKKKGTSVKKKLGNK